MATELSFDLVEEILSRVPATSLERWRYACKRWETLISDPRFVKKHLSHFRCREQQFTLFNGDCPSLNSIASYESYKRCVKDSTPVISTSHCDGLLLYVLERTLLIINPLLKQGRWISCGGGCYYAYGLGPSSSSPEYKIVRFLCARRFTHSSNKESRVEIYDFKTDHWKVVLGNSLVGFDGLPMSSVCLKGTHYWLGNDEDDFDKTLSIQSFDFSKERFEPLSVPPPYIRWTDSVSLGIFGEDQLSILCKSYLTNKLHIWVMNNQQWSILMIIDVPEVDLYRRYTSYLMENNGKFVLSGRNFDTGSVTIYTVGARRTCDIVEYDTAMDLSSEENSDVGRILAGCYYVPSLIQVPGFSGAKGRRIQ